MRLTIVTNIPTPYRTPVYERADSEVDVDLSIVYLAEREANRRWVLPPSSVRSVTLRSRVVEVGGRYVHLTSGMWSALQRLRPEVLVTTGFNPPHLVAFAWAVAHRVPHIAQTDGTVASEAVLTPVHRLVRRVVGRRSVALVAISRSGLRLVQGWGRPGTPAFLSPLVVDNDVFADRARGAVKDVDLLFSGQLSAVKDPLFALDVAAKAAERLDRRLTVAMVGDGPLREDVRARAAALADRIDVLLPGFQQQDALPSWYARSRLFLFPTRWDPWGLVLNEALAAGVPALSSSAAGSAVELLADGRAGRLLPLDRDGWADAVVELLGDEARLAAASAATAQAVSGHTLQAAVQGLLDAARLAAGRPAAQLVPRRRASAVLSRLAPSARSPRPDSSGAVRVSGSDAA